MVAVANLVVEKNWEHATAQKIDTYAADMLCDSVPKAHNAIAQGTALGIRRTKRQKPQRGGM